MKNFYKKYRKSIDFGIRMIVFAITLYYIFRELRNYPFSGQFFPSFTGFVWLVLILVFILMLINWLIEAFKWKILVGKFTSISLLESMKAVWAGLASTALVPNRTGEFIGRLFFVDSRFRPQAVSSTLISGMTQWLVTFILGSGAFLYLLDNIYSLPQIYFLLLGLLDVLLLYAFFQIHRTKNPLKNVAIINRSLSYLNLINRWELLVILLAAFSRFLVFVFQLTLLFYLFDIVLPMKDLTLRAMAIFFIQTFLPSVAITELGTRGAAVLFVFQDQSFNKLSLLAASYFLWFINVLLPMIPGAFYLLIFRQRQKTNS